MRLIIDGKSETKEYNNIYDLLDEVKTGKYRGKNILCKFRNDIYLDKPLYMEDSEKYCDSITFDSDNNFISGGKRITDFRECRLNGLRCFKAEIDADNVTSFTVNGAGRNIARSKCYKWEYSDKDKRGIRIRGYGFDDIKNPAQVEAVFLVEWRTFIFRATGTDGEYVYLNDRFREVCEFGEKTDENMFFHPNPMRHSLFLKNDVSFLNHGGQWCFDEREKVLYYIPYENETVNDVFVYGKCDKLICLKSCKNVTFRNVGFRDVNYSHVAREGFLGVNQALQYMKKVDPENTLCEYDEEDGAVEVCDSENVSFIDCSFKNISKTGISVPDGSRDLRIAQCDFYNLGGSAISVGDPANAFAEEGRIPKDILIENNTIGNIGVINYSAPAITAFFVNGVRIFHNTIFDLPYTGISVGWGWAYVPESTVCRNNEIRFNKIYDYLRVLRDGGGIYTIGQQPDSFCSDNYIHTQHEAIAGIYHDEGTAYYTTYNNFVDNDCIEYDNDLRWITLNGKMNGVNGSESVHSMYVYNNYSTNVRKYLIYNKANSRVEDAVFVSDVNDSLVGSIIENAGRKKI